MNQTIERGMEQVIAPTMEIHQFLEEWDSEYYQRAIKIPLFQKKITNSFTRQQQQKFVQILYHIRGHFGEFLWQLGNFAPGKVEKEIIIGNIRDEFGKNGQSHEALYYLFANEIGVDLKYELLEEKHYAPFAKEYIKGQMIWLRDNPWHDKLAGFAAIERLDNMDYIFLKNVAESFDVKGKGLTFFNVHICVDHFESILKNLLLKQWNTNSEVVKRNFKFVMEYQLNMWNTFSDVLISGNNV